MKINLSSEEVLKLKTIVDNTSLNRKIMDAYSTLLQENSAIITKDMVEDIKASASVDDKYAYFVLLCSVLGLDLDDNYGRQVANTYILPSINEVDTSRYYDYPFYRDISFDNIKGDNWEIKYEYLQPYELFVYNDIEVSEDYVEIPRMGFFKEEYKYPAVLEGGNEWMTLLPNEIESMRADIDKVSGDVVTFGLGLGCFSYMASLKDDVKSVTIVDKSPEVIKLFKTYILPQFKTKDKIKVIEADAYDFVKNNMREGQYDYAFVDIWHDVSDGVDMYVAFKKLEHWAPKTKFLYWIEDLILSYLRGYVFDSFLNEMVVEGSGEFLGTYKDREINTASDVVDLLTDESLRDYAKYIDKPLFEKK